MPDEAFLHTVTALLRRPGAVAPADGLEVSVRSVRRVRGEMDDELEITYTVPPLPDGVARQPLHEDDPATYALEVAEELHGWATVHVRRFRPLPPPDRDAVRRSLPPREDLWRLLLAQFRDVVEVPGGFRGVDPFDDEVTLVLTPEQWQDYVVDREIGCRHDVGVDADGPGDGPGVALEHVTETLATLDDDEHFLVADGHHLVGSTRAELPPVPGTALQRESEEIRRRVAEARRANPEAELGWYAERRDGTRDWFRDAPED
jgi:hypothetical protein